MERSTQAAVRRRTVKSSAGGATGGSLVPIEALYHPAVILDAEGRLMGANIRGLAWLDVPASGAGSFVLGNARWRDQQLVARAVRSGSVALIRLSEDADSERLHCQPIGDGEMLIEILPGETAAGELEEAVARGDDLQAHMEELRCSFELSEVTHAEALANRQNWMETSERLLEENLTLSAAIGKLSDDLAKRTRASRR